MKKLIIEVAIGLLMPVLAAAQTDFNGTWKIDLSKTVPPSELEIFLLQNGMYHCKTCGPKIDVKADAQDQGVVGSPYYDTISVKIVDDQTVEETEKKSGKIVKTAKTTVSGDGSSATVEFADSTRTNADPMIGTLVLTKTPKSKRPAAGSHAISGSWQISKLKDFSSNALLFTFKVEGDNSP